MKIIRSVSLNYENIIFRISNKSNKKMDAWILEKNTSICDCSHSHRKSKWKDNNLETTNRFDGIHKTINVSKYIEEST